MNIPKKEIGIPTATHNANLAFKKIAKNNNTNKTPTAAFSTNNSVRWVSVIEESLATFNSTLSCCWLNLSMYSFTSSAEAIKSSLLVLLTEILIAFLPLKNILSGVSDQVSFTSATSFNRIIFPFVSALTIILNSSSP
jgi:hypothetical protein